MTTDTDWPATGAEIEACRRLWIHAASGAPDDIRVNPSAIRDGYDREVSDA